MCCFARPALATFALLLSTPSAEDTVLFVKGQREVRHPDMRVTRHNQAKRSLPRRSLCQAAGAFRMSQLRLRGEKKLGLIEDKKQPVFGCAGDVDPYANAGSAFATAW